MWTLFFHLILHCVVLSIRAAGSSVLLAGTRRAILVVEVEESLFTQSLVRVLSWMLSCVRVNIGFCMNKHIHVYIWEKEERESVCMCVCDGQSNVRAYMCIHVREWCVSVYKCLHQDHHHPLNILSNSAGTVSQSSREYSMAMNQKWCLQ